MLEDDTACLLAHVKDKNSQDFSFKGELQQGETAVKVRVLLDSGAAGIFIDSDFVKKHNLKTVKKKKRIRLTLINGTHGGFVDKQVMGTFTYQGKTQVLAFDVTKLVNYPVVLGLPWLKQFNPTIDWAAGSVQLRAAGTQELPNLKVKKSAKELVPKELHDYLDMFGEEEAKVLPPHRSWDYKVILKPGEEQRLGRASNYKLSQLEVEAQKKWLDEHLQKGFIRPCNPQFSAPTFFVDKKDASGAKIDLRLVVDYRKLNNASVKNVYPIPNIENLTDRVQGAKVFTKMDLRYGYHLLRIRKGDEYKTAFSTRFGSFEYLVMPLGLCNAPAVF